jgi:hypothetical protein
VQLAEDHVGAVAAQHVGLRQPGQFVRLVPVAQDELACFEGRLPTVRAGQAAAFDGGMADAVLEAEGGAFARQRVDVLPPDRFDAGQQMVGGAGPLQDRLEPLGVGGERGQGDVDVR